MTGTVSETLLSYDHLIRLTDERGLFEHASHADPRPEHGYCVDDVARALVVVCRDLDPSDELVALAEGYLAFVLDALTPEGRAHNRRDVSGAWTDEPGLGDWWGRALWALGAAGAHAPTKAMREAAVDGFRIGARRRSPHPRSMVFAALGAGELLLTRPDERAARDLLRDAMSTIELPGPDASWPWPEPRLTYSNGSVAEALLIGGAALHDPVLVSRGLDLLAFLMRTETFHGHLSVTPVGGRGPRDARPAFDQQPLEVSALADACARAYAIARDDRWHRGVESAWAWFLGENDMATLMVDLETGAGYDGLQVDGRNANCGAESTLAAISTSQQVHRIAGHR